jgi:hypothetical protein
VTARLNTFGRLITGSYSLTRTKRMSSSMKLRARGVLVPLLCTVAVTQSVVAQPFFCTAIRPGESAVEVATRVTGAASGARESWFQIVDPSTSRVVPKARYRYVRAGWHACVATGLPAAAPPVNSNRSSNWTRHFQTAYEDVIRLVQAPGSDLGLWVVLLALIAIATHSADHYLKDRDEVLNAMQQFSRKFVREFERPLVAGDRSAPPIRSRLRFAPHTSRVDILIAPGAGRRYPNLTDHKNNVEYDLKRILNVLRDEPFVNGRPYMDGPWVVLPFSMKPAITQAGGR